MDQLAYLLPQWNLIVANSGFNRVLFLNIVLIA